MVGRLPSGLWKGSGDRGHVTMAPVSSHTTPSEAASLQRDGVACVDAPEASAQRWCTARMWCHPPKYSVGDKLLTVSYTVSPINKVEFKLEWPHVLSHPLVTA